MQALEERQMEQEKGRNNQQGAPDAGRRATLAKLGLAAAAVYAAPAITRLDQAKAAIPSHHCPPAAPKCK